MPAVHKRNISIYIEKDNHKILEKIVYEKEMTMSRFLAIEIKKIIDRELKKKEGKNV